MKKCKRAEIVVTGVGVTSALGQGKAAFTTALLHGSHNFSVMQRPGRQLPVREARERDRPAGVHLFLGAEIDDLSIPQVIPVDLLRNVSFSGQVALVTLHEAWAEANLDAVDPFRIGLVIGGSNLQQRELTRVHDAYRDRYQFLRPTYGMTFLDTDLCGVCTEQFGIQGFATTVGGASASGQLAVIQAMQAVQSGRVDVCVALGALMDLSYWECQAFRSLGAMGSNRFATEPESACRPFDRDRDGFIYGEACGAVVIERADPAIRQGVEPYAYLTGWGIAMDRNRNPNPSCEGEVRAIQAALQFASLSAGDIDYINPHGTGSVIGDATELNAIRQCGLEHACRNATKSLIGHGLSAAGAVETIATLLQMQEGRLHPTRNLDDPIDGSCNWVGHRATPHAIRNALKLSLGFGGINSAICMQRYSD